MSENMSALHIVKRQLRKKVQNTLKTLTENSINEQSSSIHERLFASPQYQAARNISIYLSMPTGEVSTEPIVKDALAKGKRVFVPFIYKTKGSTNLSLMDMVALHSESDYNGLEADKWGIPTPDRLSVAKRERCLCRDFEVGEDVKAGEHDIELAKLDLIVTPGVAFDTGKRRLGHGKGYYDNFFTRYRERVKLLDSGEAKMPYLVGIALKEQLLSSEEVVPTNESDWSLDSIIAGNITIP